MTVVGGIEIISCVAQLIRLAGMEPILLRWSKFISVREVDDY